MISDAPVLSTEIVEVIAPEFRGFIPGNAWLDTLATGFRWLEGPIWMADWNCLLFQDLPNDRTMRWMPGGTTDVFRKPSDYGNGQARDAQGRLVACSHRDRALLVTDTDGTVRPLVDRHASLRLNAPNDIARHPDGALWFTDPLYGIQSDYEGGRQLSEQPPALYRLAPETMPTVVSRADHVKNPLPPKWQPEAQAGEEMPDSLQPADEIKRGGRDPRYDGEPGPDVGFAPRFDPGPQPGHPRDLRIIPKSRDFH